MKVQSGLVRRTKAALLRFVGSAAVMLCAVVLLALIESTVLWTAGVRYTPPWRPVRAAIVDFALVRDVQGAVSCVSTRYRGSNRPVEYSLVWHNLQMAERPKRLHLDVDPRRIAAPSNGAWLAVLDKCGAIQLVSDLRNTQASSKLPGLSPGEFPELAAAPDGRMLAAATRRRILIWDTANAELLRFWPYTGGECIYLAFCPDSRELTAVGADAVVRRWDAATGRLLSSRRVAQEPIHRAAISSQGDLICWRSYFGITMGVADPATGEEFWRQVDHDCRFSRAGAPAISPNGAHVASALRLREKYWRVVVRDGKSGVVTAEIGEHKAPIRGILFNSDVALYVWDSAGEIVRWDLRTGHEIWRYAAQRPHV